MSEEWITATAEGRNISLEVPRNEAKESRTGYVVITDAESNTTTQLTVEQAKSPNFIILLTGGFLLTAKGNRIDLKL